MDDNRRTLEIVYELDKKHNRRKKMLRRGTKRTFAMLLSLSMILGGINTTAYAQGNSISTVSMEMKSVSAGDVVQISDDWDGVTRESVFEGDGFRVTFQLQDYWNGGYNANVKIDNTGDKAIENWTLGFDYQGGIGNVWNAVLDTAEQGRYVVKNAGWNQDIAAGQSVEFGISGQGDFVRFPSDYQMLGQITDVNKEDYSIDYEVVCDWGTGFNANITITNNTEENLVDWFLEFDYSRSINEIWNANIDSYEDNHYVIHNAGFNSIINAGNSITFGFSGTYGSSSDIPHNYSLHEYDLYNGDSMDIDTDNDGIVDGIEKELKLNYRMADTDGDGLSDYQELYLTITDPLLPDTDGDGTTDAEEDADRDGICNQDELLYGTDPICADTDGDNIIDSEELFKHESDPLLRDTDGDGLDDYDDVLLGFSPLLQDTDDNGILDPFEKVQQTIENDFPLNDGRGLLKVEVTMNVCGNINKKVGVNNVYEFDSLSRDVVGLIGVPVEIRCNTEFDAATIRFTYDETALGEVSEENLAVLWYNEAEGWYQLLDQDSVVNTKDNTVTYETPHFSTYMLVDKTAWYAAWRENIDYRVSGEEDTEINLFDIAFVIDVSGSMSGTRINNAKKALNSFISTMEVEDEAAIISFNSYANIVSGFTNDKLTLEKKLNSLYASGRTNVNNGLLKALEVFENHESEKKKIIVLICDGNVNYVQSTIDRCIEDKIQIYAVNVQSVSAHANLQKMADQTNGQYYYGSSVNDLSGMIGTIQNDTVNKIDPTDEDGDGLYDIYETAGIKLPNGRIIYTNPTKKDTDGDGLTDFEETGIIYNVDDRYIGLGTYRTVKYFIMRSNPSVKDTDGDGIWDKEDISPNFADQVTKNLHNKFSGVDYLNVAGLKGGRQNWWLDRTNFNPEHWWEEYEAYILSSDYRMGVMGCGVVAMTDIELYMTQQHTGYAAPLQEITYNKSNGEIAKDNYMRYAEYNRDYLYYLGDNSLNYLTGVLPANMEIGIELYLESNNHPYKKATWAPYCGGKSDAKIEVAKIIETMISRDLPVAFAYFTMSENNLLELYFNSNDARLEESDKEDVKSHYMTIIGYSKFLRDDGINYEYVLKVVSWGKIYYINYDKYSDNLSYFSNVLEIK